MTDSSPQNNPENTTEKDKLSIPKIRTFSGDIQSAVQSGNFSQANIVMAEKKRARDRGEVTEDASQESGQKKNIGLTIGYIFVILLFLAGGAGIFLFFQSNRAATNSTVTPSSLAKGFLPSAAIQQVIIEEADNKPQIVAKIKATQDKVGTDEFTKIIPVQLLTDENNKRQDAPISLEELFEKLLLSDDGFARLTDNYVYGVHKGENYFLLVQLDDPTESYARLFSWEERMQTDLLPLFPKLNEEKEVVEQAVVPEAQTTTIATEEATLDEANAPEDTTTTDTAVADNEPDEEVEADVAVTPALAVPQTETRFIYNPRNTKFTDGVFFNFEGRVARDTKNNVRLVYALITKNILVITSNPETLQAISLEIKNTTIVR